MKRVRPDDDRALKMLRVRPEFKKEPLSEKCKMEELLICDLMLMQTASYYRLAQLTERERSKRDLGDLFLTLQEKTKPDLSVEIGAYQAAFSTEMKKRLPHLQAFAFEANPHVFEHFSKSDEIKNSGVEYLHMAITGFTGNTEFLIRTDIASKVNAVSSLLSRPGPEPEPVLVPCTSLTDYFAKRHFDEEKFCAWIDVEGASKDVLIGAEATLNRCLSMFIEVEEYPYWSGQWLFWDVQRYLATHGLIPVARDFEYPHQFNVLFIAQTLLHDISVRHELERYYSKLGGSLEPG